MKIEVLFPEFCNLYGDFGNIIYLKKCLPEAEFIETNIGVKPMFLDNAIDLVYMGSMTEKVQEKIIKELLPYKNEIKEKIDVGQAMLFTGNSFEVLMNYIENEDGSRIEGLKILDFYARREMFNRYNSLFLGEVQEMKIVGYKDQFSHEYGNNNGNYFAKAIRGAGLNRESNLEGVRVNNFIGTTILGPILILNPIFTKYLIQHILNKKDAEIAFEDDAMDAYLKRLEEYEDKNRKS